MKAKVYPPIWSCIYCGSTDAPLGKEHVLAYGLGGNLVLPRASCQKCAAKTKGFEETVLRRMFGPYRIRLDMPTRHPEQRPKKLPFGVVKQDGSVSVVNIDAKEHPGSIVFPIYPEPGILVGRDPKANLRLRFHATVFDYPRVKALAATHGGKGFNIGGADLNAMARLLAKTAYAYCFAEFGGVRAGYRPLVLDLIAGDPNSCPTHCVGCASLSEPAPEPGVPYILNIHEVQAHGTGYIVVDIRLFAFLQSPVYRVAVQAAFTKAHHSSRHLP